MKEGWLHDSDEYFFFQIFFQQHFSLRSFTKIVWLLLAAISINGLNIVLILSHPWYSVHFTYLVFSWKHLKEECWSEGKQQLTFKYFMKFCFIHKLFSKVWK